ncbi:H-2 class II histocompatibility antigen, E-S beta chain-like [Stegastes partitus]|uniref:H-2 class II histocompatibility antigen, E-S beta chain-like n=1 Tax=Stegastes partitus TaxID=144197 RepID=A0A3B5BIN6_9TELE|nr:PREDICTED: H-2 class II histocompatibility antigen, E-S beta chain-like [Stegastes partitus]
MRVHGFLSLLGVFMVFSRADAVFAHGVLRCLFTSTEDVLYLEQIYFNKLLLGQYNSTLGKYTGYTEKAHEKAEALNKDKKALDQEKIKFLICKFHISWVLDKISKPVEPTVKLTLVEATGGRHPNMLVCSAYDFYPKLIQLSWLRNGKETKTDVLSTEELSNGNWYYQIHSYLEFTPSPGEKISCKVDHASLKEPKLYDWELFDESERNKFAVGGAGLLLGLLVFVAGLIFYKKNSVGRTLVPTG